MSAPAPNLDEPPPLSLEVLIDPKEKKDALKLVVDSVAQQRQVASRTIIFHPVSLATFAAALAVAHYVAGVGNDFSAMLITYPGIIITYLVAVRFYTSAYIRIAEDTDWLGWLKNSDGVEDTIIGARFGQDIIAAVILRLDGSSGRKSSDKRALIRAWTTRTKYRRRGLGGDMLREAIKIVKQAQGQDSTVEFADDHANSKLPLPETFNGPFRAREARAKKALAAAVKDWEDGKTGPQ
ncbi:gnat family [Fusarium albosuccineum]|uniref:Gnat family n=1 Tax=Fusarium albosuccineum TaxID=1237068 RepID=A0A8H4PEU7_9HYPO|nr:gnat family [Fusarium albosuccineum]